MEESTHFQSRPNLNDRLFWDWKVEEVDWQKSARSIIERVLQWGNDEEYDELTRFYGREKIIRVLKIEKCSVWNICKDRVTNHFGLKEEELSCYRWRQEHGYNWI